MVVRATGPPVIPVVAGFQGINARSDVTTLGRGGSDLTAVALAAALKADRCIIYTDVDGVYTADPNIVPAARRLEKISYEEMLEMASLGAKVLQSRSVEFAAKYAVPVEVNSSFKEGKGTLVTREDADMEGVMVSGVTGDRNQAKITIVGVPDRPGIAARLFGSVANANIVVDMIIQNVSQASMTDISFTVPKPDLRSAVDLVQHLAQEIGARSVAVTESIAKVSLIGVGMRSHSGVAARMFEILSRERFAVDIAGFTLHRVEDRLARDAAVAANLDVVDQNTRRRLRKGDRRSDERECADCQTPDLEHMSNPRAWRQ